LTGNGTAQFTQGGGAPAAKTVTVTLDIGNKTIKITDADSAVLVDAKTGLVAAALKLKKN
jgi:hypothetical protein